MKVIKRISSTTTIVLFCFFALNVANAAIIWDNYFFSYAVGENSADIYNVNIDEFNPAATLVGPTPQKTNTDDGTDPVTAKAVSSTPTDPTGLGLQFNAGAAGQLLSNGVRLEGYAATSTTSSGVLDPYAVGSPAIQEVSAFLNRTFHVDSNQAAKLSAMAGGIINDPEFFVNGFLRADYSWEGGVWLDEVVTIQGVPVVINSWFINFDDLLNDGPQGQLVSLRTQTDTGDLVSYTLRTELFLDNEINNTHPLGGRMGDIPIGDLGSLGSKDDPLIIEATMKALDPSCKGDFDGDKDVDGEDLYQFMGAEESVALERFAEEFGRTDCL